MRLFSLFFLVLSCLTVTACSDNAPNAHEVEQVLKDKTIHQALQFQGLLTSLLGDKEALKNKKEEVTAHINKTFHVDSVSCTKVSGFNSVYDCTVNAIVNGIPRTSLYRFTRQEDGSLTGLEKD